MTVLYGLGTKHDKDHNGNKLGLPAFCVILGLYIYSILSKLNLCMYVFTE